MSNTKNSFQTSDEIYPKVEVVNIFEKTGYKMRPGLDNFIVVAGEVVKVASKDYGLAENRQFFGAFEQKLDDAGILYTKRATNNRNRNFKVDYILQDESFHIAVGPKLTSKAKDYIKPMITAINSYDGSQQTIGGFAGFREVCSNGLHVAQMQVGFKVRHRGNIIEIVMPKIEDVIAQFMDNEFYTLHKKFEVLAESTVPNIHEFVKYVLGKTGLAKYEKSEKQPDEPSKAAEHIIATMQKESAQLGVAPSLWLGYNAFNEYIHTVNNKLFTLKQDADKKMFSAIMEMAN
jgi:hypothetical protein